MMRLALASVRSRASGFTALFVAVLLGATIITAFGSLLSTAAADGVSAEDEETLVTMASVVGGWGLAIVLFAVASTVSLSVQQRGAELALLRSTGATPWQVLRLLVAETVTVAIVAAALAVALPAWLIGRWIVALLHDAQMVAPELEHSAGPGTAGVGVAVMVVVSVVAALIASRRATRTSANTALTESDTGAARMGRIRVAVAVLLVGAGVSQSFLTVFVTSDAEDPYTAMSTAGPASVLASIGIALLAPALVAGAARVASGPLRVAGASGHLAAAQARVRARQQGAVLMPIILFTGIATGTLYLLAIDDAARTASQAVSLTEAHTIEALNLVVVGMIAVFAAIMVVNTLVAATLHRRSEFGAQRLVGSTPGQVVSMVSAEGALLAVTGIVLGSLASLATVVPYSIVRLDRVLPDTGVGTYVGIVVVALAVTLGSGLGATRVALRTPAVQAAA